MAQIPYLDVQNLTKSFGAQVLFKDISFSIAEGQHVGLVAQNGTGKSTLLSILTGKEGYDSGSIIYRNDLRVGMLEQSPHFDPEESVLDACFNHEGNPERLLKAKQILTMLKLYNLEQPMGQLSGGQQKRVALANVLILEPDFLILDEPTSHLDIETEFEIKEKLLELFKGRTVIIATHRLHWLHNVDYVLNLENGKVVDFEKVVDFKNSPRFEKLKNNLVGGGYSEK